MFILFLFIYFTQLVVHDQLARKVRERGDSQPRQEKKRKEYRKRVYTPPPPFWYVDEETEQNFKEEGAIRFEGSPNFNAFRPESVIALENFLQKGKYPIDSICNLKAI